MNGTESDNGTDRRTDGRIAASLHAPHIAGRAGTYYVKIHFPYVYKSIFAARSYCKAQFVYTQLSKSYYFFRLSVCGAPIGRVLAAPCFEMATTHIITLFLSIIHFLCQRVITASRSSHSVHALVPLKTKLFLAVQFSLYTFTQLRLRAISRLQAAG